jgi:hypothetical protein
MRSNVQITLAIYRMHRELRLDLEQSLIHDHKRIIANMKASLIEHRGTQLPDCPPSIESATTSRMHPSTLCRNEQKNPLLRT